MAQRGTRPATQDGSPEHCHPGRLTREVGVHTPVERLPSADAQLRVDQTNVEPGICDLPAGYYAVLEA